ncbi:MOSC N-terminal beta barrel domain-containing protein [Mycolicibacterium sp. S2-37]|uniref:MOSC domain-containing protein n=1 Tax=Mycolicibacterium sp. S2-37 TaxID=2810297 RepID=UPI001A9450B8|nr:MOSC N-terminal beta barrel domain-containing protein [Mycolicibacterium sp. S2-37]MBO0680920.1 MOSC N-terminal beta barrel domain-containing protein [Mycolicibacterium sp. S2-37]
MRVGQVAGLWRYPVKSLGGERIEQADIGEHGVLGDRLWAVRDVARDVTLSARRVPALLTATARYPEPTPSDAGPGNVPDVEITFPDGTVVSGRDEAVHAKLSELAGREVRLTALPPAGDLSLHRLSKAERDNTSIAALRTDFGITENEKLPDVSMMRISDLMTFARYSTPPGMFVDLAPVHVMSQTSLATIGAEIGAEVDVRRFRPNVLLALDDPDGGLPEHRWTGGRLTLGGTVLEVTMPTIRCVVPSRAQPGLDVDRRITKVVAARANRCLGSYCWVDTGGAVRTGDEVVLAARRSNALTAAAKRAKRLAFGVATAAADRLSR